MIRFITTGMGEELEVIKANARDGCGLEGNSEEDRSLKKRCRYE